MNGLRKIRTLLPLLSIISLSCALGISAAGGESLFLSRYETIKVERNISYCDTDPALKMDIYRPLNTGAPVPAIIYVHGGGWYSGDKNDSIGQDNILPLVERGYLVAAINYRLAPRYQFPAQIEDVKCAVRFLRVNAAKFGIDPAYIGSLGDSAGGHLVALLGVTGNSAFETTEASGEPSDRVQAVVDLYGPSDLELTFEKNYSMLIDHVFGTDDPASDIIKQASPVTYVSSDDSPFLIIHGNKDDTVLLEQSQELYERLVSAGVPASLLIVQNAGHAFVPTGGPISPTPAEITDRIADFFDQYLKPSYYAASLKSTINLSNVESSH